MNQKEKLIWCINKAKEAVRSEKKRIKATAVVLVAASVLMLYLNNALEAVSRVPVEPRLFEVRAGEGFRGIVGGLREGGFIKSEVAFGALSLVTGSATDLKPGRYQLSPSMTSYEILNDLLVGAHREISVMIPEGSNEYEIDGILSANGITKRGDFAAKVTERKLEGRLFPDTYKFFTDSDPIDVVNKFLENFGRKIAALPGGALSDADLTLASMLDKEVPGLDDQEVVAGILKKRTANGIPLQVDATVCYVKESRDPKHEGCYPLSPADFKIDSPYNTYEHIGLPPGPIGNPGTGAIVAALHPKSSPYFFYLSDPKTGKTIFAKTLDEHIQNQRTYLK